MSDRTKLASLMESEGYEDSMEFLEECMMDSVVMGICVNDGCSYTTEVELDCYDGWCEMCRSQSVSSALVLAGVI